jgi:SNF2 family DNA or RNA helicase
VNDYNAIKKFSRSELEAMVPDDFRFDTVPWKHQLGAFLVSLTHILDTGEGFLDCMDMGTGKTKVAIDICRFIAQRYKLRILVVCLNSAVENWADEVDIHSNNFKAVSVRGNPKDRWSLLTDTGYDFSIVNFEGLRALLTKRKSKSDKSKGHRTMVDEVKVGKLISEGKFNFLIIDESHKAKSATSINFQLLGIISKFVKYRLPLTGTPFGNTLLDVWAQYFLMDFGKTFGRSFFAFRAKYFEDKGKLSRAGRWIPKWEPTDDGMAVIKKKMFTKAIRYSEDEVDDLPKKVYRKINFSMSDEQWREYGRLLSAIKEGRQIPSNYAQLMRNICSGFERLKVLQKVEASLYGGSVTTKAITQDKIKHFKTNPKLDLLADTLDNIISMGRKAVVYYEFIPEGLMIEEMLRKRLKVKFNVLCGRIKDKHKEYTQFAADPERKVLVAHPMSGGQSINLVAANYCIFFSNGRKVIDRIQCEKRIHRGGQKAKHTYFYDFVAKGSVENKILNDLRDGKDIVDFMLTPEDFAGD